MPYRTTPLQILPRRHNFGVMLAAASRSLNINSELMLRLDHPQFTVDARGVFARTLEHCCRMNPEEWSRSRSLWRRVRERWAYLLLVRLDPYIAWRQWRTLKGVKTLKR